MSRRLAACLLVALVVLGAAGCTPTGEQAAATAVPPAATPMPPTETPLPPTPTSVPPTETPLPPTPTPLPPTETSPPPTPTSTPAEILSPTPTLDPAVFQLRSPAFGMEERIPSVHTCDGKDISPPLEWGDPPEGTQSLAVLMDDVSAGGLVHWLLFNIPPDKRSLPEGVPRRGHLSDGSQQGTNTALKVGYAGPCPSGMMNHYRFRLFALDTMLDLEDGIMLIPLKQAMKDHILAETELVGIYAR